MDQKIVRVARQIGGILMYHFIHTRILKISSGGKVQ